MKLLQQLLPILFYALTTGGFQVPASPSLRRSSFVAHRVQIKRVPQAYNNASTTSLSMFLGNDGGILGIGAPEVAVIALVGYFLLGPEELYKLTKDIGKFVTNLRSIATETTTNFQESMEENLQLKEIQKAQSELNDAFNFRRSINYDEDDEFTGTATATEGGVNAVKSEGATADPVKKRKKVRRKKKKVLSEEEEFPPIGEEEGSIPSYSDDVLSAGPKTSINKDIGDEWYNTASEIKSDIPQDLDMSSSFDETKSLREQRMERLQQQQQQGSNNNMSAELSFEEKMTQQQEAEAAQARFAAQLSGNWNDQILDNEDKLGPMAQVMDRLALLEEERQAAEARLEQEFRLKAELEEKYYRQKRALLEAAGNQIQMQAYQFDEKVDETSSVDDEISTETNGSSNLEDKDDDDESESEVSDVEIKSEAKDDPSQETTVAVEASLKVDTKQ